MSGHLFPTFSSSLEWHYKGTKFSWIFQIFRPLFLLFFLIFFLLVILSAFFALVHHPSFGSFLYPVLKYLYICYFPLHLLLTSAPGFRVVRPGLPPRPPRPPSLSGWGASSTLLRKLLTPADGWRMTVVQRRPSHSPSPRVMAYILISIKLFILYTYINTFIYLYSYLSIKYSCIPIK